MESEKRKGAIRKKLRERKSSLFSAALGSSLLKEEGESESTEGLLFLSGRSDLFSSKLLYPSTHSLASCSFEVKDDIRILIESKTANIFQHTQ